MSGKHLSAEAFHALHKFHKECSVCQRLAANDQPGLIQEVLLTRAENETLRAEWEHAIRHLAAICDAQDAGEDVRSHVHAASAYLLAADVAQTVLDEPIPSTPSTSSERSDDANDPSEPS